MESVTMRGTPAFRSTAVRVAGYLCVSVAVLALAGCQGWDTPPDFGDTVRQAARAQQVNPNAPAGNITPTTGMDGPAAKSTIDNYERGFINPQLNQTNLGSVSGQPTGGSSAPASTATGATGSTVRP